MVEFKISNDNIKKIKQNYLFLILPALIIGSIISQTIIYFKLQDIKIFLISLGIFIIISSILILFLLKFGLKYIEKSVKSIKYKFENGNLRIYQNNFEQFNIFKDEIKYINKYKNNLLVIIMNNNKKININKYLENYDNLLTELKQLTDITEINRNPYLFLNILSGIIAVIVMGVFFISKNLIFVILSSVLLFSFCLYLVIINLQNKNIEPKKKKMLYLLLPIIFIVIISRILEILGIL